MATAPRDRLRPAPPVRPAPRMDAAMLAHALSLVDSGVPPRERFTSLLQFVKDYLRACGRPPRSVLAQIEALVPVGERSE